MKYFILLFLFAGFFTAAQQKNTFVTDSKTGKQMLLGFIDRTVLTDTTFASWYDPEYKDYNVDIPSLDVVVNNLKDISITIVLGTWCSDSHMQVPRFLKILDAVSFSYEDNLTLIAVDRSKHGLANETADMDIKAVPTFIIFKN